MIPGSPPHELCVSFDMTPDGWQVVVVPLLGARARIVLTKPGVHWLRHGGW